MAEVSQQQQASTPDAEASAKWAIATRTKCGDDSSCVMDASAIAACSAVTYGAGSGVCAAGVPIAFDAIGAVASKLGLMAAGVYDYNSVKWALQEQAQQVYENTVNSLHEAWNLARNQLGLPYEPYDPEPDLLDYLYNESKAWTMVGEGLRHYWWNDAAMEPCWDPDNTWRSVRGVAGPNPWCINHWGQPQKCSQDCAQAFMDGVWTQLVYFRLNPLAEAAKVMIERMKVKLAAERQAKTPFVMRSVGWDRSKLMDAIPYQIPLTWYEKAAVMAVFAGAGIVAGAVISRRRRGRR